MTDKLKIEKLYCFIADNEDGEGVTAFYSEHGWMPMVGADMRRVLALMEIAQTLVDASGKKITLCEFSVRTELEVIEPKTTPQEDAAFKS